MRCRSLFALVVMVPALAGCPTVAEEDARVAIQQAFEQANPPGRTGVELRGKSVWLKAPMFDEECLHSKDLAFSDRAGDRPRSSKEMRISPTYNAQRYLTGFTEQGWCVYTGSDPTLDLRDGSWEGDRWEFFAVFGMREPTPWFECLQYDVLHRGVLVTRADDGSAKVGTDMTLMHGECAHPLPGGERRRSAVRPSTKAPRAPSMEQVRSLLGEFDQALWDRDFEEALSLVSCYNVFEEQRYGSCSVAELITLAPLPRNGVTRPEDGPPWSMNVIDSLDQLQRIFPDRDDESLFHVQVDPNRGDKQRSLALQWVSGTWKLVGVVGLKAEDLTTMRIIYDLDRKEKREIFERRMQGEQIDEKGNPYDPYAEYREE